MENNELQIFKKTIIKDEKEGIFVQFLCDFFEIDSKYQSKFIQNDPILRTQVEKKTNNFIFGDNRQRLSLTKKGFLRWVQILNPNIIKYELREKFIQYQVLVFDYLYEERLIPNIKRQYEIDIRLKELNKIINKAMLEHKILEIEKKQLTRSNYTQLGLDFPDEGDNQLTSSSIQTNSLTK